MNDYTVWGLCYDPEWLRETDGDPDMQLIAPGPLDNARKHQRALSLLAPGAEFQIRDADGNVIPLEPETSTPHEARVKRARRALGHGAGA